MRVSVIYGLLAISAVLVIQTEAIKCHINRLGDDYIDAEWKKAKDDNEELCGGSCTSANIQGEYEHRTFTLDTGACKGNASENSVFAASLHRGKMYDFHCDTELCNSKNSPKRDEAKALLTSANALIQKMSWGSQSELTCHDSKGESIDCKDGYCTLFRQYTGVTAESTSTECVTSLGHLTQRKEFKVLGQKDGNMANQLFGNYGLLVNVVYEGQIKKTNFTVFCRNKDCNEKNSLDAEFESILKSKGASSVLTAVMPVLLVLSAMLNM